MSIKPTDFITTHAVQGMKSYITYDAYNRMEYVYEAPVEAQAGSACMVTQYAYEGASTRVVKMKESNAVWQAGWDI